jgi:acetylornithine deacetylase
MQNNMPIDATKALDVAALAADLVGIDSTSGSEGEVVSFLADLLALRGWQVKKIPVSTGRDDLLATAADAPLVTLSTHLDTVPPFIPPRFVGGRLYGRGSCDAKGIAAAMCCAGERLRARGVPVALLFVVGEETVHDGAMAANLVPTTSRVLINGEPTESTLALGTKGAMRLTVRTAGKAAHSAYPHLGHSATRDLVRLLAEMDGLALPRDPVLGETTINIGSLAGGVADNVVAPWAEARLMARLVSPVEELTSVLRQWIGSRATLEEHVLVPPVLLGTLPGYTTSVVAYATDIPKLSNWGKPYLFGPGSIHVAHTDDEFVELEELRQAVGIYEKLATESLS